MSCSLAIIIVSYNTRTELEHCLAMIAEHPPSVPHEIVVVDNASSDGTVPALRARWPSLRIVEAGDNLGFARATNLGIRSTSSGVFRGIRSSGPVHYLTLLRKFLLITPH